MIVSRLLSRGAVLRVINNFEKSTYSGSSRSLSVSSPSNMKILQFAYPKRPDEVRAGYLVGDKVVDINKLDSTLPKTLIEMLRQGGPCVLHKNALEKMSSSESVPLSSVILKAPITGMDKVICVGLNYKDHCEEQKLTPPAVPMFFSKFPSCVIGPSDYVRLRTGVTSKVDWEVELVVVINQPASNVAAHDAFKYVLGYSIAQDVSARDWQKERNAGQFLLGKSMDTFCPIGPCIVTHDEIKDPENLDISCSVNGVFKQNSNTNQLLYKIPEIIERLTSVMTLLPGDIILTGTPGGVGMYRSPPEYLKPGDEIVNKIQGIGELTVRVKQF